MPVYETPRRTLIKTLIYRAGSVAVVAPLQALVIQLLTTGHIVSASLPSLIGAVALADSILNSAYYYGYERLAARFHRGYVVPAGPTTPEARPGRPGDP